MEHGNIHKEVSSWDVYREVPYSDSDVYKEFNMCMFIVYKGVLYYFTQKVMFIKEFHMWLFIKEYYTIYKESLDRGPRRIIPQGDSAWLIYIILVTTQLR